MGRLSSRTRRRKLAKPQAGEGEAVERDRGGEDTCRVRGEVPLHAAGDGVAPDRVQIHAGHHGRVKLQYQ